MKGKLFTSLALAVLLAVALVTAGVMTAPLARAASPACGSGCMTLTSERFGPNYVSAAVPSRILVHPAPVVMAWSGPYESEDFQSLYLGTVAELYSDGIVSASVALNWPDSPAYEYGYAPGGRLGTLCMGISAPDANGVPVTLQPCGVSARTVWIAIPSSASRVFTPLVNGADENDNDPYVLTAATDNGQLTVQELVVYFGRIPAQDQMWRDMDGVIS
jgi:hypothetical protein